MIFRHARIRGGLLGLLAALVIGGTALAVGPFLETDATAVVTLRGEIPGESFGWVAASIGDITGDGVNEFITSAPFSPAGGRGAGKFFIYTGDGTLLHSATGNPRSWFGYSVAGIGDANGDTVPDYIVGGPGVPVTVPAWQGRATIFSGSDHRVLQELQAPESGAFGSAVNAAGDVNGDGYADVIVGAEQSNFNGAAAGRVYLFSGKDGSLLWVRDGDGEGALFGTGVGLVGDVNYDGIPDVVAAARGGGRNGRGYALVLSGNTGQIIHTLAAKGTPPPPLAGTYGQFFANGAGDIDRDGTPDIYIGDYNAIIDEVAGTGRVYIYSGRTGKLIRQFKGDQPGDGMGPGRGIGDINGDGYGDLIIASYTSSAGVAGGGLVEIYSGRNRKVLRTITGAMAGENIGGDALSIGDVTGDGLTDYIITAYTAPGTPGTLYVVPGVPEKDKR
jgi:hypothetical protein